MTEINQNPQNLKQKNCSLKKLKTCWQKFHPSKPFIAVSFVLLGVGATLIAQNFSKTRQQYLVIQDNFPFFSRVAFADNDFFAEMREMERKMNQDLANHQKYMREIFDKAQKDSNQSNVSQVTSSEDADNYYYQLDFSGFKKEEIVVAIKDNVLSFSAENKKSENSKDLSSTSSASFHYSFAVPQYNFKKELEIIRKDNQIIVKLMKKK